MPELPFPDLATPAERATQPPPFAHVVGRARRQRRRKVLSIATATAAILAVATTSAVLTTGGRSSGPEPAKPSPTTSPSTSAADQIIARAGVSDFAMDAEGDVLTLWSTCLASSDGDHCDFAWRLATANGTSTGVLPRNSGPRVIAGNGGFVVTSWHGGGIVVDPGGSTQPLKRIGQRAVSPGNVVVDMRGGTGVADAKTATWFPLTDAEASRLTGGLVAGETVWTEEGVPGDQTGASVAWSRDGAPWQHHAISGAGTTAGVVTAVGDHVAASTGRVADDYNPLAVWSTSSDAGKSWTELSASQLPFGDADEMAATPGGTLYVHSLLDGLFRSTDGSWTRFEKVPGRWLVSQLHQVQSGVAMLQWQHHKPQQIVVFDDGGRSTPVPLAR